MKYVLLFIGWSFIFPSILFAQETSQIVAVKKGDIVPFSGTLLNQTATATILADKEFDKKKCDLDKEYELLKMRTTNDRDVGNIKIELDIVNRKYTTITTLKDEEIKRLTDVAVTAEKKSNNYMWWAALGTGVGITMSIGIFFAASYALK